MRRQRGTFLVIIALVLLLLVGIGALVLDLGRVFVVRSEMQNAADAAALAGAMELDGRPLARARAEAAARELLQHGSKFAEQHELLGDSIAVDFSCAIGSTADPADIGGHCANPYVDGRAPAATDRETRYVRVTLDADAAAGAYSLQLWFLPVLRMVLPETTRRALLRADATAGRTWFMCDYPPTMMCNPFEPSGTAFRDRATAGQQIELKQQGEAWAPGNFAFLEPDVEAGGGAPDVADYLADQGRTGCSPPTIRTKTGAMTNKTAAAINTRLDLYRPPAPFNRPGAYREFPPAPVVIDYPRDRTWRADDARFGNGDWDRAAYFATFHDWQGHVRPAGWATMTRYQVHGWEIASNLLPSKAPLKVTDDPTYDGIPVAGHLHTGSYPPPLSDGARRVLFVAVVDCLAQGVGGATDVTLGPSEGFAKLFLTEHVNPPPDASIFVEFIKWADETDSEYHLDVQLYD